MAGVVHVKRPVIGVNRARLPPLAVLFAYREDDGEEDHPRVVMPHSNVDFGIRVIERNGDSALDASLIERVFKARGLGFVEAARLRVPTCFPPALCHD